MKFAVSGGVTTITDIVDEAIIHSQP
jgi:hypothetical protein